MREPMKACKRNLGKLHIVAAMNCQTDTDCIDWRATVSAPSGPVQVGDDSPRRENLSIPTVGKEIF